MDLGSTGGGDILQTISKWLAYSSYFWLKKRNKEEHSIRLRRA